MYMQGAREVLFSTEACQLKLHSMSSLCFRRMTPRRTCLRHHCKAHQHVSARTEAVGRSWVWTDSRKLFLGVYVGEKSPVKSRAIRSSPLLCQERLSLWPTLQGRIAVRNGLFPGSSSYPQLHTTVGSRSVFSGMASGVKERRHLKWHCCRSGQRCQHSGPTFNAAVIPRPCTPPPLCCGDERRVWGAWVSRSWI